MAANAPDNSPRLSEYERLRERRETIGEIKEAKVDMRDSGPGVAEKRKALNELGEKRKLKGVVEVRRSERYKKPVSYVMDKDQDGRGRKSARILPERKRNAKQVSSVARKTNKSLPPVAVRVSSSHSFLARQPVNKMFDLEVAKSTVKMKDAGEGVFNRGQVIPEGTVFGPYTGNFIPVAEYKETEKAGLESGNAWEIWDDEKTVGYIDPGMKPDSSVHWMSKVNCATTAYDQNLVGFQLAGQVYYKAIVDIELGVELMVFYGETYASEMGINVDIYEKFVGKEDQTKEAVACKYCKSTFDGKKKLEEHLKKGENMAYRCGVKQTMEMVRMAETGERRFVCKKCGKGFKKRSLLNFHGSAHSKFKAFHCTAAGCGKAYSRKNTLDRHKKVVHDGVDHECPDCGKRFGRKSSFTAHHKMVHLQERPFKCAKCGIVFSSKQKLTSHIITVHKKIKEFKCDQCDKRFGHTDIRKTHIAIVHSLIRYPCTWCETCSHQAFSKEQLKYHIRRVHTKEWSWECQLCEDQLNIWWGCIYPWEMKKHKAKKHPVEWEEEQEAYRRDHPFICKYKKCGNRFASKVEVKRHQNNLH